MALGQINNCSVTLSNNLFCNFCVIDKNYKLKIEKHRK